MRQAGSEPMEAPPDVVAACTDAHARMLERLLGLDDDTARRPSRLPDWSVGHVLTHLARNADSHSGVLEAALEGRSERQYPGGEEQREGDIAAGAGRPADELVADLAASCLRLERAWASMTPEAWGGHGFRSSGEVWPCQLMPLHRWREVEIHQVDLGLGYTAEEWPEAFVAAELPSAAARLAERVGTPAERAQLLAWLFDRGGQPTLDLLGWQQAPSPGTAP